MEKLYSVEQREEVSLDILEISEDEENIFMETVHSENDLEVELNAELISALE